MRATTRIPTFPLMTILKSIAATPPALSSNDKEDIAYAESQRASPIISIPLTRKTQAVSLREVTR
jgi:hypothetical protein